MRRLAALALCGCASGAAVVPPANRVSAATGVETIAELEEPVEVAVGDGELFVIAGPDLQHAIYHVPARPGSAPVKLADAPGAKSLVLDGGHLYWADGDGVFAMPIAGGSPEVALPSQNTVWSVVVRQGTLFAGTYLPGGRRSQVVMQTTAATAGLRQIAGETPTVLVDGDAVYVGTDQTLTKLDHFATPIELARVDGGATAIAKAGHDIYFAAYTTIQHVSDVGGPVTQLAIAGGETYSIAVDAHYVYWAAFVPDDGAIYRIARSGGRPERMLRAGEATLAIAGSYLYWTDARQNAIRRLRL